MLDAFIIDRIRRQQDRCEDKRVPLQIEVPPPPYEPEPRRDEREQEERGITVVDFSI